MSEPLPLMTPEEAELFRSLDAYDSAFMEVGNQARFDMCRTGGNISMTVRMLKPELSDYPMTVEGRFPSYAAAFLALAEGLCNSEHRAVAEQRALEGLPSN